MSSSTHVLQRIGAPTLCHYLRGTWRLTRIMRHTKTKALMGTVDDAIATFIDSHEPTSSASFTPQTNSSEQKLTTQRQQEQEQPQEKEKEQKHEQQHEQPQQPKEQLLLYREEGKVNFSPDSKSDKTFPFYREYMYNFKSAIEADVYFYQPQNETEHMKFFHTLTIAASGAGVTSEHLCIDDVYLATINLESASAFQMSWKVTGPKKDYQIVTKYSRVEDNFDASGT